MLGAHLDSTDSNAATLEAVNTLQSNNAEAIESQRKHRRFEIRTRVVVHPSDAVDRGNQKWLGECHDISKGGCRLLTQKPLQIGSVYWIQFEPSDVKLDPVFARCVRGHLLRENAFELGMCFLTPIELPQPENSEETDLVLP